MPEAPTNPTRILGLDPGLTTSTALTNSRNLFIIDGHWLKSINQNFNRRRAAFDVRTDKRDGFHEIREKLPCQIELHLKRKEPAGSRRLFYKAALLYRGFRLKNKVEVIVW